VSSFGLEVIHAALWLRLHLGAIRFAHESVDLVAVRDAETVHCLVEEW